MPLVLSTWQYSLQNFNMRRARHVTIRNRSGHARLVTSTRLCPPIIMSCTQQIKLKVHGYINGEPGRGYCSYVRAWHGARKILVSALAPRSSLAIATSEQIIIIYVYIILYDTRFPSVLYCFLYI